MPQFLYLVQIDDIIKVGTTYQENKDCLQQYRTRTYGKTSQILLICCVRKGYDIETLVKREFKKNFTLVKGTEWFKGDSTLMIKIICETIISDEKTRFDEKIDIVSTETRETVSEIKQKCLACGYPVIAETIYYINDLDMNIYQIYVHLLKDGSNAICPTSKQKLIITWFQKNFELTDNTNDICHISDINDKFTNSPEFDYLFPWHNHQIKSTIRDTLKRYYPKLIIINGAIKGCRQKF